MLIRKTSEPNLQVMLENNEATLLHDILLSVSFDQSEHGAFAERLSEMLFAAGIETNGIRRTIIDDGIVKIEKEP